MCDEHLLCWTAGDTAAGCRLQLISADYDVTQPSIFPAFNQSITFLSHYAYSLYARDDWFATNSIIDTLAHCTEFLLCAKLSGDRFSCNSGKPLALERSLADCM